MDFEQLLTRYFEIDKEIKSDSTILNADEIVKLKTEHEKIYSEFFKTFMVVRVKLGLDPELKCHEWLKQEYDQIIEMRKLLNDTDDV